MIKGIREIEIAMGDGSSSDRKFSQGEMINRENLGKSLVAAHSLKKGAILQASDIKVLSPGQGLSPQYFESLIEAIERTSDSNTQHDSVTAYKNTIEYKRKKDWSTSTAVYSDENKAILLYRNIVASQPKIKLIVKDDSGGVLYTTCFDDVRFSGRYFGGDTSKGSIDPYGLPYSQFYAMNTPKAYIGMYGGYKSDFSLKLYVGANLEKFKKMHKNEVSIVNAVECRI